MVPHCRKVSLSVRKQINASSKLRRSENRLVIARRTLILLTMSSRAEQKAAARAAREAKLREHHAAKKRQRVFALLGVLGVVVVALVVIILISSSGSGALKANPGSHKTDVASVKRLLDGIPESGNVLGYASAPVTITEYGDLVCPICYEFSQSSEPQLIASEVRSGHVKLAFRGFETASATANGSEYVDTQTAARSAGLQGREWYYILLMYDEQPQTINGADAETVPYITTNYLQQLAEQVPGLNLVNWQAGVSNQTLINDVTADTQAANAAKVTGTPTIIASGPKGTQTSPVPVPTLAQLQTLIAQVS